MTGPDSATTLAQQIALLRSAYGASLAAKWQCLTHLWQQLDQELPDATIAGSFQRRLHQLAGSAGMYGYTQLGQSAQAIETLMGLAVLEGFTLWPQQRCQTTELMNQMKAELERQGILPH